MCGVPKVSGSEMQGMHGVEEDSCPAGPWETLLHRGCIGVTCQHTPLWLSTLGTQLLLRFRSPALTCPLPWPVPSFETQVLSYLCPWLLRFLPLGSAAMVKGQVQETKDPQVPAMKVQDTRAQQRGPGGAWG